MKKAIQESQKHSEKLMGTLLKEIDQIEEVVGLIKSEAAVASKKDQTVLKTLKNEVKQEDLAPTEKKVPKPEMPEKKQQKGTGSKKRLAKKDYKEAKAETPPKEKKETYKERKASQKSEAEKGKSPQKEKAQQSENVEEYEKTSLEEKS